MKQLCGVKTVMAALMAALMLVAAPAPSEAREAPESFANLVEKLTPAVVNIATAQKIKAKQSAPGFPELPPGQDFDEFREFFERFGNPYGRGEEGNGAEREVYSLGSGFIIDASGYVVTNNHVIADAEEIKVLLSDETKLTAKIVGRDAKTDLALLKVEAGRPLPYVTFGDSDAVRVGDWVIAIGNPFGLGGTVTAGIISARARNINAGPFDDFLQTDAAINRGNSGGPMFNMNGEVVGINSAIFSPSGGNIGIGFAVPTALAKPIIAQLKQYGRTHRGWLGVKIQEVSEEIAESVGLPSPQGAMVLEVNQTGPAEKAGILPGDIILSFDGRDIKTMRTLPRLVAEAPIGKKAEVTVWRDGKRKTVDLTLGELKEEEQAEESAAPDEKSSRSGVKTQSLLGMKLARLTPALREEFGLAANARGLIVVQIDPNSEAAKRGIRSGDLLQKVNEETIEDVKNMSDALADAKKAGRKSALVRLLRGEDVLFVTLPAQ